MEIRQVNNKIKQLFLLKALFLILIFFLITLPTQAKSELQVKEFSWRDNKVQVIIIPATANILPAAARPGLTVLNWSERKGAIAAINGGYFNHSDGWPVSKVMVNGKAVTNPEQNRALLNNKILKPVLFRVFYERPEWRLLLNGNKILREIVPHRTTVKPGYKLVHSLQAGPQLLPVMDLAKEGFTIKNKKGETIRDGIGSQQHSARSAIGIKAKGETLFVGVSSTGKGKGITVPQLAELMKELGSVSAMALDGGSSTSIAWKEGKNWNFFVGSGKTSAVVNSVLLVLP
jgi:exopolysaccharide biosynthesis protein